MAKFCSNCGKEIDENASFCGGCGTPVEGTAADTGANTQAAAPVQYHGKKKMWLALLLTFLLGPIGLLYANVKHALILVVATVVVSFLTSGMGGMAGWVASMIWAYKDVNEYNSECE